MTQIRLFTTELRRDQIKLLIKPFNHYREHRKSRLAANVLTHTTAPHTIGAIVLTLAALAWFFWPNAAVESQTLQSETQSLALVSDITLLTAAANPNPYGGVGGADLVVEDNALVSGGPVGEDVLAAHGTKRDAVRVYTVREGDSLSLVAEMFGITTNTIMWANDLSKASDIQPGQVLVILPVAGVQHTVKKGDTIASVVSLYDGDLQEVLSFNNLEEDASLTLGQTLIVPGGSLRSIQARAASAKPVTVSGTVAGASNTAGMVHPVPGAIRTQGIHGKNAVDYGAAYGTSIRAAAAGEVIESKSSGWNGGYGQYIKIRHNNGVVTLYSHMSRNDVGVGEWVGQGQVIGGMGDTGKVTGVHLHFEVIGASNPF